MLLLNFEVGFETVKHRVSDGIHLFGGKVCKGN